MKTKIFFVIIIVFLSISISASITLTEKEIENKIKISEKLLEKAEQSPDEIQRVIIIFSKKPEWYRNFIESLNRESRIIHDYDIIEGIAVSLPGSVIERLRELKNVISIQEDREVHALLQDSVPLISAPDVWVKDVTGKGVKVCIVDTGVDYNHSALGGCLGPSCKVIGGYDFVNNDNDPKDDNGHGTHVAGIVSSDNPNARGVANGTKILAVKVLDSAGSGYMSDVISGIEWCTNNGANITSLSLGGGFYWYRDNCDETADSQAINAAVDAGVVVVVAAGNDNDLQRGISSPGCASKAITVGATRKSDAIEYWSSRGEELDISAPGVAINSTVLNNGWAVYSGTSMATPHVSGVAALVLQTNPNLNSEAVKYTIEKTAVDFGLTAWDIPYGFGRVNASAAYYHASSTPKLGLHKTRSKYSIMENETVTIIINVTNYGNESALNVEVIDSVPEGLKIVSGSNSASYSSILPEEIRSFSYVINGTEGEYFLGEATTSYSDGVNSYNAKSNKPSIRIWKNRLTDSIREDFAKNYPITISGNKNFIARLEWNNPNPDLDLYLYLIYPPSEYPSDFSWYGGIDEEVWFSNTQAGTWTLRVVGYGDGLPGKYTQSFNLYYSEYTPKSYTTIQDSDFESGDLGSAKQGLWQETEFRDTGYEIFTGVAGFSPRSGKHHAEISYVNDRFGSATTRATAYGQISQTVNLTDCSEANLTSWVSSPGSVVSNYFNYSILIYNGTENILWERKDNAGAFGWTELNLNISRFCGQIVNIIFRMKNVYGDIVSTETRRFWIDDVLITKVTLPAEFISITLYGYPIDFESQNPGTENNNATGNNINQYKIKVEPETTVNVDIYQKGDDFSYNGKILDISNMSWYNENNSTSSYQMLNNYQDKISNILPGTNISSYYWLDIPLGQYAGNYETTIYIKAVETGSAP